MIISYLIICFNTSILECIDIPYTDLNTKIKGNFGLTLSVFTQFQFTAWVSKTDNSLFRFFT